MSHSQGLLHPVYLQPPTMAQAETINTCRLSPPGHGTVCHAAAKQTPRSGKDGGWWESRLGGRSGRELRKVWEQRSPRSEPCLGELVLKEQNRQRAGGRPPGLPAPHIPTAQARGVRVLLRYVAQGHPLGTSGHSPGGPPPAHSQRGRAEPLWAAWEAGRFRAQVAFAHLK